MLFSLGRKRFLENFLSQLQWADPKKTRWLRVSVNQFDSEWQKFYEGVNVWGIFCISLAWVDALYCIGTWNVRSMNQGKFEVVKQEMARVNVDILGISELKWTGMGEFTSDDHYIYYCGQESLRRDGVAIMVNKRVWNAVLGCNLKNDRIISVHFQGKPFSITVIQDYVPTSNPEEAEAEQFYEDLQGLLDLTPKKYVLFIVGDWNAKVGSQETPGVTGKFGLGIQNEAGQRLIEFCQENALVIANTLFQQHKRRLYTWTSPDGQHRNQTDYIPCSQRWRSCIESAKTRPGADCGSSWTPYCQIQT